MIRYTITDRFTTFITKPIFTPAFILSSILPVVCIAICSISITSMIIRLSL